MQTYFSIRPIDPTKPVVVGKSPDRYWERTETGWTSRQWEKDERKEYITTVLNRNPYIGEH